MGDKVPNEDLLAAGVELMRQEGRPLTKLSTGTRAMLYELPTGETVRVRTCNDHILVVLADSPHPTATLNIEGTDYLLIVMPTRPRTPGPVVAYCVPTSIVVEAARRTHAEWLASSPATSGNNRTWNLWIDDAQTPHGGFARKWQQYRLSGSASTTLLDPEHAPVPQRAKSAEAPRVQRARPLGEIIADARKQIAEAAGVPIETVKISVNFVV